MSTPTIVLRAARVTTTYVKDSDTSRLVVSAFRPSADSRSELLRHDEKSMDFILDIEDETGSFTAGVVWTMQDLTIADDRQALTMVLVKAK